MSFRPLLLVMAPRHIRRCMAAIAALDIDKAYLVGMYEAQLVPVIAGIVERHPEYTHFVLLADDTVPTQAALDLVLEHAPHHPCVTGYVNNDVASPLVNLTTKPFAIRDRSVWEDYHFRTRAEVEAWPDPLVPSHFTGATLTTMSREMWQRYPFGVNTHDGEPRGYCSDWNLCVRLQADGVPIVAPRGAFVEHVKEKANTQDFTDPEKRLLVGEIAAEVQWLVKGRAFIETPELLPIEWPVRGAA